MTKQCNPACEKFIALHQFAVLLVGVVVMTISPEGSLSLVLPFVVALSPILFALFGLPIGDAKVGDETHRRRIYFLSSLIGFLCALGMTGMWVLWLWVDGLRALASAS